MLTARLKLIFTILLPLLLFSALTYWGGKPPETNLGFFMAGVVLLIGAVFGFGFLYWQMLLRPLPAGHKQPTGKMLPAIYRQLLGGLLGLSGISLVVGGFWDEVWHRQYGLPFGEDLLWRPHLLLYFSFGTISLLTFAAMYYLLKFSKGSLAQRFRMDPLLGSLVIVGGFVLFALPADPLWHVLYGADITAWSLPHILLLLCFVVIMVLTVAILLSTLPIKSWRLVWQAQPREWLVLFIFSFALTVSLQVLTTEWDVFDPSPSAVFLSRPEWLFPTIVLALSVWAGTVLNYSVRLVGAATITGLIAYGVRAGLIAIFGYGEMSANGWLIALPAMVSLDLGFLGYWRWKGKMPAFYLHGFSAMVGMSLVSFPLINQLFARPQITSSNLWMMLLSGLSAGICASWIGSTLGDFLATQYKQTDDALSVNPRLHLIPPVAFILLTLFILFFILTATPPI